MTLYRPAHFRDDDPERLREFIERHAFATLVSSGAQGLDVSHVPLLPRRGEGGALRLLGHVARANGHWKGLESSGHVLAIFHGPHAYVSPRWYAQHPSVPTWNYAVVHAHCRARLLDEPELRELLAQLSATYEAASPQPWQMSSLPADFEAAMLRAIVGFELTVERLEGKFKLSQNRPAEVPRVIEALREEEPATAAAMAEQAALGKGKISP